jgi:hypothetical protein
MNKVGKAMARIQEALMAAEKPERDRSATKSD